MDTMHRKRTPAEALLAEVDQLGAAVARLELGLAELAVEQYATAALLAQARTGVTPRRVVPATAYVPRLTMVRGDTRTHDRHRAHPA